MWLLMLLLLVNVKLLLTFRQACYVVKMSKKAISDSDVA